MLFNSYEFVFLLLPLTLLIWYGLNRVRLYAAAKVSLVIASLIFYAYFNWSYLPIILGSIAVNYLIGLVLVSDAPKALRRIAVWMGVLGNLGVLGYFKYFDFFLQNLNLLFHADFAMRNIVLPLGISFFTFQQLSYVIDCYKRTVPKYNFLDYALFVSFFPQLVAGPIVLHSEIVPQFADLSRKTFQADHFCKGVTAFAFGLAKKVLIADALGIVVNSGFDTLSAISGAQAWLTMLCYTMQIYFDFSGYCDMATGIGQMFNIELPMNFNSPYKAADIVGFWKRWHITLTRFFTHYVYFPLGGNRKGTARTYLNIFIVFLVSGIWHGAGYTFIVWGMLHGAASILCRALKKPLRRVPKAMLWIVHFLFLNLTWVIFRAPTMADAAMLYRRLFAGGWGIQETLRTALERNILNNLLLNLGIPQNELVYILLMVAVALLLSLLCRNTNERIERFRPTFASTAVVIVLLSVSILSLSGVSTFLYFNF